MIYVALAVLFVLAVIAVLAALRRRQSDAAIGMLSRETRKRDRATGPLQGEPAVTGREVERAAAQARNARVPATAADAAPPAPYVPADPETVGVSRRQFFNRTIVMLMSLSLSSFGVAVIAFLWPQGSDGFGSKIRVGLVSDLLAEIRSNSGFLYKPEGRMWLTEYPNGAVEKAAAAYSAAELAGMTAGQQLGLDAGIVALYQKCPHLGCRVPECVTSQWFECPCHGSRYNQVGEKRSGPAPRGMDRFATEVAVDGSLIVDTGTIIQGPPIGTNTTGQEAEGAACIGQATGDH
ncbi:MAG: Rieske 2Fe-2S domain-containing protein [Acidimicrobiaceae bacterium]|nr:Rieske 2Fe-2S domain-containing protein [Acidimicrobiaceae bacterium]MCY4175969.1 Rieske 2Fe-2S domain-containing protein [Acidimicrobiaceae bacterium]MCY4279468.1 Rieske 2Fe-2S domain-containing protein [Acidimicrobiaceae bacterium]MCY4294836.1 Rieske 2Fe-2S domain-containing protein [Acidimicrobiaceae bacterium]